MGQGLTAEAVEELTQAARDKTLAVASYSLIGQGYRQKRNFEEAAKWLEKAMAEARPGSDQYFALVYDLAEVLEAADDRDQALALFREIRAWNPGYRNVSARLERPRELLRRLSRAAGRFRTPGRGPSPPGRASRTARGRRRSPRPSAACSAAGDSRRGRSPPCSGARSGRNPPS